MSYTLQDLHDPIAESFIRQSQGIRPAIQRSEQLVRGVRRGLLVLQHEVALDLVDVRGELLVQDHVHQQRLHLLGGEGQLARDEGNGHLLVRPGEIQQYLRKGMEEVDDKPDERTCTTVIDSRHKKEVYGYVE